MCTPVSTISSADAANSRASVSTSRGGRERLAPRASVVAQKVQCSSHPSWILSHARVFRSKRWRIGSLVDRWRPRAASTPSVSAPWTTRRTPGSAAIVPSSTAAAHPMTTVPSPGRSRRSRRTKPRIFRSAADVTVQELTTAASARRGSCTIATPAASSA
jgi:hypothetical protein